MKGIQENGDFKKSYLEALGIIDYLWQIIDDIDTAGDIAKSNDKLYRSITERLQVKRWKTNITTDGYVLDITKMQIPRSPLKTKSQ